MAESLKYLYAFNSFSVRMGTNPTCLYPEIGCGLIAVLRPSLGFGPVVQAEGLGPQPPTPHSAAASDDLSHTLPQEGQKVNICSPLLSSQGPCGMGATSCPTQRALSGLGIHGLGTVGPGTDGGCRPFVAPNPAHPYFRMTIIILCKHTQIHTYTLHICSLT